MVVEFSNPLVVELLTGLIVRFRFLLNGNCLYHQTVGLSINRRQAMCRQRLKFYVDEPLFKFAHTILLQMEILAVYVWTSILIQWLHLKDVCTGSIKPAMSAGSNKKISVLSAKQLLLLNLNK
jgi:hypothetical protein